MQSPQGARYAIFQMSIVFVAVSLALNDSQAAHPRGRGTAGQRADLGYNTAVANPAYVEKHPRILFDDSHFNFHITTGRYKPFTNLIEHDGYRVVPSRGRFDAQALASFDILVTANALGSADQGASAFTDDECSAIRDWVSGGGSLLLITDIPPWGAPGENLAAQFGVKMSKGIVADRANQRDLGLLFSRGKNQIAVHPITEGRDESERIERVLTFAGQSLIAPEGSVAFLTFAETAVDFSEAGQVSAAGRAQGVALTFGDGRVVVLGEAAQVSAQLVNRPPQKMGMNVPSCDNRQMTLNMMHWLSRLID